MIGYEPIVNSPMIHHIIIYRCFADISSLYPGGNQICINSANQNIPGFSSCQTPFTLSAGANAARIYESNMGKEMPAFVLMEIHHSNPQGLVGVEDSSGVKITYTETLRPIVVGVLTLGKLIVYHRSYVPKSYFSTTKNAIR
jgi:hypothetical protein